MQTTRLQLRRRSLAERRPGGGAASSPPAIPYVLATPSSQHIGSSINFAPTQPQATVRFSLTPLEAVPRVDAKSSSSSPMISHHLRVSA